MFVVGGWGDGPCTAWFRLRSPIVAGETPSALQRLAAAGDFGNGISAALSWDDYLFINPDLTLYIEREPVGEWICLESETRIARDGIGVAESVLYDERGRVGRATQALLVARADRPTPCPPGLCSSPSMGDSWRRRWAAGRGTRTPRSGARRRGCWRGRSSESRRPKG